MKLAVFSSLFMVFFIFGCTKADPEAYKGDPILQDYQSQHAVLNSQLESVSKQIATTEKELKNSVPQSGQRTLHLKKLAQLKEQASKLTQQIQFWKIRIESRAKEAQTEYLDSYKNKKPWPNKEKIAAYFTEKRLRISKMQWDQKSRIENYKKSKSNGAANSHEGSQNEAGGGHE